MTRSSEKPCLTVFNYRIIYARKKLGNSVKNLIFYILIMYSVLKNIWNNQNFNDSVKTQMTRKKKII